MIISSLVDGYGDASRGEVGGTADVAASNNDHQHEYQTASQLFELMAQDHDFNTTEDESLTQRDLVLIYKNLDLGTQLMSNANEFKRYRPNQYVETIVYKDEGDSDSSELSDTQYRSDDLGNMAVVNKERIDLLLSCGSGSNILSNKLGNMYGPASILNAGYNSRFFNDDYSVLPDSLLDFICCKRLEDNYNFYMDSIIIYVKHTIDQLKRISEGDYLTDRVKEKWREVDSKENKYNNEVKPNTKVLATCTSIPLPIERKITGGFTKWNDIVHSEVDLRSLSKILEKKIVIEVPKAICDSYKLLSKCYTDNLVISCTKQNKNEQTEKTDGDSRVDVVFQLKPSTSGQVISNINSIMILHTTPALAQEESHTKLLPLSYKNDSNILDLQDDKKEDDKDEELNVKVKEFKEDVIALNYEVNEYATPQVTVNLESEQTSNLESYGDTIVVPDEDIIIPQSEPPSQSEDTVNIKIPKAELLSMTIQRLNQNALSCMPEESEDEIVLNVLNQKKSLPKRVKSPYENKNYLMEEKKRKHLLEIRQKRENKKRAMGENSNLNTHKYGLDSMAAKASNSITQISISNKSFYNSIFGKASSESKQIKNKTNRKPRKSESAINKQYNRTESLEGDSSSWKTENSDKKRMNKSYDLDDVETEMMQTTDIRKETASTPDCSVKFDYSDTVEENATCSDQGSSSQQYFNQSTEEKTNVKGSNENKTTDKHTPALECRKNISKIYDLVQHLGKSGETKTTKSKFTAFNNERRNSVPDEVHKVNIEKDSLGSHKEALLSSPKNSGRNSYKETNEIQMKRELTLTNSPKSQTRKSDAARAKEFKSLKLPTQSDNPLKALSEIIHSIDNLKKTQGEKIAKSVNPQEIKTEKRQDKFSKDQDNVKKNFQTQTVRKQKPIPLNNRAGVDKILKRIISDVSDEEKEARGEAVKGPSNFSRIDALAQPRKSYVLAHREETMAKLGLKLSPQKTSPKVAVGDKIPAKTSVSRRQQKNLTEAISPKGLVSPTMPPPLDHRRSPPSRAGAGLSPPRHTAMTSWTTSHRQPTSRTQGKGMPDTVKKDPTKVKHVSYEDPLITRGRNRSPSPTKYLDRDNHYWITSYLREKKTSEITSYPIVVIWKEQGNKIGQGNMELKCVPSKGFRAQNHIGINQKIGETVQEIVNNMPSSTTDTIDNPTESSEFDSHNSDNNNIKSENCSLFTYSLSSDHEIDVLQDKAIVTGVQEIQANVTEILNAKRNNNLTAEMLKLEKIHRRKQGCNSRKLKLTPDQTMQQMLVLQSGDAGSILFQSNSRLKMKQTSDYRLTNDNSKRHFDFSLTHIPMQVNTIGYAFTKLDKVQSGPVNMKLNCFCNLNSDHFIVRPNTTCKCSSTSDLKCVSTNVDDENNAERIVDETVKENTTQGDDKAKMINERKQENQSPIQENIKSDIDVTSNETADESNSLDVLVGLLNEIQKITTCQTNITNTFQGDTNSDDTSETNDLEKVFKKAAALSNPSDYERGKNPLKILSVTSLEKLRQLNSNPSLYSIYISNVDNFIERNGSSPISIHSENFQGITTNRDKEITANLPVKEYISRVTDVPSTFYNVTLHNKGINVSDSLNRILLNERPTISRYCSTEQQRINSNFQCCHCTVEIPFNLTKKDLKHCLASCPKIMEEPKAIGSLKLEENVRLMNANKDVPIADFSRKISEYCSEVSETNHVLKMKRDILVTFYSILVFTVFAALSFPAELI